MGEKMNQKTIKILSIILIVVAIFCMTQPVLAANGSGLINNFDGNSAGIGANAGTALIQKVVNPILSVVRIVAAGIAIIMITYLGIKYMSAAPSEKAGIKTQLLAFVIGVIVAFGATKLVEILIGFSATL